MGSTALYVPEEVGHGHVPQLCVYMNSYGVF